MNVAFFGHVAYVDSHYSTLNKSNIILIVDVHLMFSDESMLFSFAKCLKLFGSIVRNANICMQKRKSLVLVHIILTVFVVENLSDMLKLVQDFKSTHITNSYYMAGIASIASKQTKRKRLLGYILNGTWINECSRFVRGMHFHLMV